MKFPTILTALCAAFTLSSAYGKPGDCFWYPDTASFEYREFSVIAPASYTLTKAAIGAAMGTASATVDGLSKTIRCNYKIHPIVTYKYWIEGTPVPGYTDVYDTGLPGVGVRLLDSSSRQIPFEGSYSNAPAMVTNITPKLNFQFVRTGRDVANGPAKMNFVIRYKVMDWEAANIVVQGQTNLTTPNYFSGCTGTESININLSRVARSEVDKAPERAFNLDVLCAGANAGSKLPVKVYFEGASRGTGLLSLTPGGAKGVEIQLTTDKGIKLPFTKSSALSMTWTQSEPQGELYRLPVVAKYVRQGAAVIEPGIANAALNYILEYN